MVEFFKIGIGWNLAEGSLAPFVPYQPLTPGLQYTRRSALAYGVKDEGPFILFTWGQISESDFQALLTQAGLLSATEGPVTLWAQNDNYIWTRLNGTAVKPLNEGRKGYWLNNVPLLVKGIFNVT